MRVGWGCLFVALLAAGCEDDTTGPAPTPVALSWIGSFSDASTSGAIALDLVEVGERVTGELVITRIPNLEAVEHLLVRGTLRNAVLHLELDTDRVPYQYTFNLDADGDGSSNLAGTVSYPVAGVNASVLCRPLPRGQVTVELSVEVPTSVLAMVFDGSKIWLSTLGDDYLRMTTNGVIEDQVAVLYEGAHWTSNALTFDGNHLLGFLPTATAGPGGTINGSAMFEFDAGGILRRYDLPHRTSGLAFDGTYYWSLDGGSRRMMRFDASGAISDSVGIEVPDPYHLEFDGEHFWTTSWYTLKLYELGTDGRWRSTTYRSRRREVSRPASPSRARTFGTGRRSVSSRPGCTA